MATKTKHTLLTEVQTGQFTGQLSRTSRGAELVTLMRSFFYEAERRPVTQKINFLLKDLAELEYVVDQLKSERHKQSGSPAPDGEAPAIPEDRKG